MYRREHLIDLDRVDLPVGLSEVRWVVANKIDTGVQTADIGGLRALWELARVHLTGPSATEVGVDDDTHICKMRLDVAGVSSAALGIDRWRAKG